MVCVFLHPRGWQEHKGFAADLIKSRVKAAPYDAWGMHSKSQRAYVRTVVGTKLQSTARASRRCEKGEL
eukprot:4323529-Pyramimonas_sp.AAC.1